MKGWQMDALDEEQVAKVKEFFEDDNYDEVHSIYKQAGVYKYNSCETCQNNEQIKIWTIWAMEELW